MVHSSAAAAAAAVVAALDYTDPECTALDCNLLELVADSFADTVDCVADVVHCGTNHPNKFAELERPTAADAVEGVAVAHTAFAAGPIRIAVVPGLESAGTA